MLDAVTFDLGSASRPTFSLPDASGLVPLVLPMEFLPWQQHQLAEPSAGTVNRFEAAMYVEPRLSKSAVVNLIECTIPGVPVVVDKPVSAPTERLDVPSMPQTVQIGRASCRERVLRLV